MYVDGKETPLMNSQYWDIPGKLNLGSPPKGGCVTLAISFDHKLQDGFIKGTFTNGERTDGSWQCSVSADPGWEKPG